MKKKIVTMILLVLCMTSVSACGKGNISAETNTESAVQTEDASGVESAKTEDLSGYLVSYKASDYVTLGDYKNIEVAVENGKMTDELLDEYMTFVMQQTPVTKEVNDRKLQMGDIANIDYCGKLDGVAFEGGTAEGYDLTIGSGQFISGFEDGCIGMEIGETRDVEATFPDPYHSDELAGKTAIFTVTLNGIKEKVYLEEPTEEFVKNYGAEGVNTVEEFKEYIKEELQSELDTNIINAAVPMVESNCEFKDMPEAVVNRMHDTLVANVTNYQQMYGMEAGEIVSYLYGGAAEDYETTLNTQAEMMAKQCFMLQAIADAEGLAVSEDEYKEAIKAAASEAGYSVDTYEHLISKEGYREYLMTQKIIKFIGEKAVVK